VETKVGDKGIRELSKRLFVLTFGRVHLRNNLYILFPLAYSVAVLIYYLVYGKVLALLPTLFFLGAVPIVAYLGSSKQMLKYWVSFISILLSYEALQGTVGSLAASVDIFAVYNVDKMIWGFNVTGWIQTALKSPAMTTVTSIFYSLHFPLVVATCIVIWYAKKPLFGRYVTAMVLTSYAALVTFILIPTAPPWYQGVATNLYQSAYVSALPQGVLSFESLVDADKFAAFPSLHAAYAIIFSYFMIRLDRRLALVSIPITVGILFSTLYLGQHYLIDLIGGAIYALVPCLIAERFQIHIPGTQPKAP
jgi:membrane-associated phospholipid phosphatase